MTDEKQEEKDHAKPTPRSFSFVADPTYWQSLGQFVEAFALAEIGLFTYLHMCAGIPGTTARALLSGIHADQIIGLIRRIWEISPPYPDVRKMVDDAIIQFKAISEARNSIVHWTKPLRGSSLI